MAFQDGGGDTRVHEATDDTVPQSVSARIARTAVDVDEVDVALGDTVVRAGSRPTATPAPPRDLPPVPVALRPRYRVQVGDADPIELDRPVLLGRSPRAARIPEAVSPRLVPVASPGGEISSTHLEVREQGGVVVVTDMRTLNGSRVRVPGSRARALLGGDSLVVTPGTRIELGEGVVVEVLSPARAVAR